MRKVLMGIFAVLMLSSMVFAQTELSITTIQHVDDPATDDASPYLGQLVTVEGWVTFEPKSKGGGSFFVADAAGAWNGINVYLSGADLDLGFGWKVRVTGTVEAYQGLTEIVPAAAENIEVLVDTVDWTNLPAACDYTVVPMSDLAGGAATAEQWESVLVEVHDVTCSNIDAGYGEWEISDGTNAINIDNPQDDVFGYAHKWLQDQPYERIRGILNSHYGYKILPEISFDLKVDTDPSAGWYDQISYFQQVRPMDMTLRYDDDGNGFLYDYSYASHIRYDPDGEFGDTLNVHGIVTMPTGLSYAGDGKKFIFSDYLTGEFSEPWSAVMCYDSDASALPNLYEGDEISLTGYISEYSTNDLSYMTELFITAPINIGEAGLTTPTPDTVTVPELRNTQLCERWGNVMVSTYDNIVVNNNLQYGLFTIDNDVQDDIPGMKVNDDSEEMDEYVVPPLGANIEKVSGWIYNHYGSYDDDDGTDFAYKLEPLYPDWVVLGEGPPNVLSVTRNFGTPAADTDVTVTALIADNSAVTSASIFYKIGIDGTLAEVVMTQGEGISWSGVIPGQAEGSMVWYYVEANDDNSTSSTSPSDLTVGLYGYLAKENVTIYDVQYTPFEAGASPYSGNVVTLTGTITSGGANAVKYADNTYGPAYFMQTGDSAPFSGILVHIQPDTLSCNVGDNITVTGMVDDTGLGWEYKWGDNTRLVNVTSAVLNSSNNNYTVHSVDAAVVNAALEAHESVFVEFSDIEITAINEHDWEFTSNGETFLLDEDLIPDSDELTHAWFAALEVGSTVDFIRGVITYSFGSWKLEVRGMMDVGVNSVGGQTEVLPLAFNLAPVYPNPFNPTANIRFTLPDNANVKLIVYNALGRQVRTLIDAPRVAGHHAAFWDGKNNMGAEVASGTYFLRLWTADNQQVQKMVLMK